MISTKKMIAFLKTIVLFQHSLFIANAFSPCSTGIHHAAPAVGSSIKASSHMIMKRTRTGKRCSNKTHNNGFFSTSVSSDESESIRTNNIGDQILPQCPTSTSPISLPTGSATSATTDKTYYNVASGNSYSITLPSYINTRKKRTSAVTLFSSMSPYCHQSPKGKTITSGKRRKRMNERRTRTMLKLSRMLQVPERTNNVIFPFSLSTVRNTLLHRNMKKHRDNSINENIRDFRKRATLTSMVLFAEMLCANSNDNSIMSETNDDTATSTYYHIPPRTYNVILPFSLSTVANPLLNLRNRKKKIISSSMMLFSETLCDNEDDYIMSKLDDDPEITFLNKTTITHCETHRSFLSDTSTFEFERRKHKEVENDFGGSSTSKSFHTVSGVGIGDDAFVKEQFEHGLMAFSKAEFDEANIVEKEVIADQQLRFMENLEAEKAKLIGYYSMSSDSSDRYFSILLGLNMIQLRPNPNDEDNDQSNSNEVGFE